MQYTKVTFAVSSEEQSSMLVAMLADIGYDGFEETQDSLIAYIAQPNFHEEELRILAGRVGAAYSTEIVEEQNWNALWESNFPPVIVEGLCTIRADFHELEVTTPYDIQITPKMSFGTGHHATTQLMMQLMSKIELRDKSVFDFGTGTGVLAILAEMMGAAKVLAIDNDSWCVENADENVVRNNCAAVEVALGSFEDGGPDEVDVILANINRHILLQYMQQIYGKLKKGGIVLMSGLLQDDEPVIVAAAKNAGLNFITMKTQQNWIALQFDKM